MEDELQKLPLVSLPEDYVDRVMKHIARAQTRQRNMLMALGALTLTLTAGVVATLPEITHELFAWLGNPVANLTPWFELEAGGAMPDVIFVVLVLAVVLSSISLLFLARLNEQWTGVTT